MNENASKGFFSGLATKALALVVLLVAAWLLFKVVIGVVAAVAWVVVAVLAVMAVVLHRRGRAAARDDRGDLLSLRAQRAAPPLRRVRLRDADHLPGVPALRPRPGVPARGLRAQRLGLTAAPG